MPNFSIKIDVKAFLLMTQTKIFFYYCNTAFNKKKCSHYLTEQNNEIVNDFFRKLK
jgi:hypothetical protein